MQPELSVVFWGTYDSGKPRIRILRRGLSDNGITVTECHQTVWEGIEDKYQLKTWRQRLPYILKLFVSYPNLLWRFMRLSKPDAVLVGYMGHIDLLLLWPFARFRGVPIIWDSYLSLYDTVADDRRMYSPQHWLSRLLFFIEWLDVRACDTLLVDTHAHGDYFIETYGANPSKVRRVFVGAESDAFYPPQKPLNNTQSASPFRILFYGHFIPLHGVDIIFQAMRLCHEEPIHWQLIGDGQDSDRIKHQVNELGMSNLSWVTWTPYTELVEAIHHADICLGIFGNSSKARRVIPNKVFQIIAAGGRLVTADTPAVRELLNPGPGITLVPTNDPQALADAIKRLRKQPADQIDVDRHLMAHRRRILPKVIGYTFLRAVLDLVKKPEPGV